MEAKNQPDAKGLVHERQRAAVELVRDVYAGTFRMRERASVYLPKFPKETSVGYAARVATAVLFNAFRRTAAGVTGMIFRKPPVLSDDVPPTFVKHAENIDLAGRALPVFLRDVCENGVVDGHSHVFVDYQPVAPGALQTLDDERAADLRPYWVNILKMQVLRFKTVNINGRAVLVEFVYSETTSEPDGDYGEKAVERVRRYQLVQVADGSTTRRQVLFTLWKKSKNQHGADEWVTDGKPIFMTIGRIPVSTFYGGARVGFMESVPALLDLAFENVRHFQLRSDRDNTLHICGVPIPVFVGMDQEDGTLAVGSDIGIRISNPSGSASYLEPQGNALSATREELQDIEQRMAALGLAMLQRQSRSAETAHAKEIDKSESDSQLATVARSLEDMAEEAMSFHAEWIDEKPDAGGSIEVNKDFQALSLEPAQVKELREMVGAGQLSLESMWERLVAGEWLPDTFDAEAERQRIDESMPVPVIETDPKPAPVPEPEPKAA